MGEPTIYRSRAPRNHIDRLYEIANLAKMGAAASDTALKLHDLDSAQCTLWEVIYTLASEAIDIAETEHKEPPRSETTSPVERGDQHD